MKTLLSAVFVVIAVWVFSPILRAEEERPGDDKVRMVEMVAELIGDAQTVVICDFHLPEGTKITEVLVGDLKRLGQLWNSEIFPRKPILAYEYVGDHIGSGSGTLMRTGHFELDRSKRFVVLESIVEGEGKPTRTMIPLDDIKRELTKKKEQNKSEMATPRKPSD